MRLLFLTNFYPPHSIGGYEQWCQEMALQLKRRGHLVQVVTSRYQVDKQSGLNDGVIRSLHLQASMDYYRPADFFLRRRGQEQEDIQELRRGIDRFSPDLVVVWGMWDFSQGLPYNAEHWMPGRVAYYVADYWPMNKDAHEEYWDSPARSRAAELVKSTFRILARAELRREGYPPRLRFDHAKCCSGYVRDTLVASSKLPATTGVLHGGIDPAPFIHDCSPACKPQNGVLQLLYFGGLAPHKGVHTALESMSILKRREAMACPQLTILGSGHQEYEAHLRRTVTQLGVESQVHFLSRVPRDEIPALLRKFDVFVFTSIWPEPMARTVMEAMASGIAVIGSNVGGQREMLVDGVNSLVFQPGDAAELAERIMKVRNNPQLRPRLAEAGRKMVLERFTLDRMANEFDVWLTSIVA